MKNKSSRSPKMNLERRIENEFNNNYNNFKNLTEIKNSFESSVIRSEKKKLELNQN
jgi:predicted transport protein